MPGSTDEHRPERPAQPLPGCGLAEPLPDASALPGAVETGSTDDEPQGDPVAQAPPGVVSAPTWLTDLRGGDFRRGFYQSFGDHAVHFVQRSDRHLVVSFDNRSSVRDDAVDRDSWGYGFIRDNGWSHLGVMAFRPNWFRDDDLIGYLRRVADDGLFRRFGAVTMIGTSMGAYAATAFASLAPGCNVVAFSPQSTLSGTLVPWERRFPAGRRADWTGAFADGAAESRAAGRVWLIYDPLFEADRRHVARYDAPNVVRLRARHAGHKTALFLRRAGLLSTIVREAVEGTLDEAGFYRSYRQGRTLPWYLNGLADRVAAAGHIGRLRRCQSILAGMGRVQVARGLDARFPDLLSSATQGG